jgi:hypothetical protein
MGLGNNRDYVTQDRSARRRLSIVKARAAELALTGKDPVAAYAEASQELNTGKLNDRLKAWVDPILAHRRKMKEERDQMKEKS